MLAGVGELLPSCWMAPANMSMLPQPASASAFCTLAGENCFIAAVNVCIAGMFGLYHVAENTSERSPLIEDPNCWGMAGDTPIEPAMTQALELTWFMSACSWGAAVP